MTAQPLEVASVWTAVCCLGDIPREQGVAALLGGEQVAVFRTHDDAVFAVDNCDPWTGANVLARGIVGSRGATPTVASPLHKQVFSLVDGACFDDPDMSVGAYAARVVDGVVEVARP